MAFKIKAETYVTSEISDLDVGFIPCTVFIHPGRQDFYVGLLYSFCVPNFHPGFLKIHLTPVHPWCLYFESVDRKFFLDPR